jgi:hypothetical protein
MIDNLLEIEIAYSMLGDLTGDGDEHPIDTHNNKLKCGIEPVDQNLDEFCLIDE